jgi:hypothetical protein
MNTAKYAEKKYNAVAYWMAIQFDLHHYFVFVGSIESLQGSTGISITKCRSGVLGKILVDRNRHYFDFDFYKNLRSRATSR